jgi:hypothetical protein
MSYPKATILCIHEHGEGLVARKMLLSNEGYGGPGSGNGAARHRFLSLDDKPFFIIWLDEWKKRNQVSE